MLHCDVMTMTNTIDFHVHLYPPEIVKNAPKIAESNAVINEFKTDIVLVLFSVMMRTN